VQLEGLVPSDSIQAVAEGWRSDEKRVVFTNGCFDLLHPGHLSLLEDASTLGDVLVVAINGDDSVRRLKGEGRPIYPAEERAELLLALRWVDAVTVFDEDTPQVVIEEIRPDVLVKGAEYGAGEIVGEAFVTSYGGIVKRFPMREGYATSRIVKRISDK
jgi:D-beta-D-heptose 7-phosphate kinase/D-beta-D-heptose 1-phosphate adenosyltransferase